MGPERRRQGRACAAARPLRSSPGSARRPAVGRGRRDRPGRHAPSPLALAAAGHTVVAATPSTPGRLPGVPRRAGGRGRGRCRRCCCSPSPTTRCRRSSPSWPRRGGPARRAGGAPQRPVRHRGAGPAGRGRGAAAGAAPGDDAARGARRRGPAARGGLRGDRRRRAAAGRRGAGARDGRGAGAGPGGARPAYHAALAHAANHLVTLVADAADLLRDAGVDDAAAVLGPLLQAALDQRPRRRGRRADRPGGPRRRGHGGRAPPHPGAAIPAWPRPTWRWPGGPPPARSPPTGSTPTPPPACSTP